MANEQAVQLMVDGALQWYLERAETARRNMTRPDIWPTPMYRYVAERCLEEGLTSTRKRQKARVVEARVKVVTATRLVIGEDVWQASGL